MRIAVLNRQGAGSGGATRAAQRLIRGLRQQGHEASMISLAPGHDPEGIGIEAAAPVNAQDRLALRANALLQTAYIAPRRTALSNTLFSSEVAGLSLAASDVLATCDVINIHWVPGFLAPHNIEELVASGKPVVCTLHDMAAFTGGCHYSAGCEGYRASCAPCAQMMPDELGLAAWTLGEKRRVLRAPNVIAVAPSRWLATCAEASGVFLPGHVQVIPNGLDTAVFRPTGQAVAKRALGIAPHVKTLLFGAETGREHRKGFDLLLQALRRLREEPVIAALLAANRLRVLAFGDGSEALQNEGVPVETLGVVRHDAYLSLIYSAADLLVLPSREDNLPNVLLEAMACGTPAVAFAVGGVAEVIEDGCDGRLVPAEDTAAMAAAVLGLFGSDGGAAEMGGRARAKVIERYALGVQAKAYAALFQQLLAPCDARGASDCGAIAAVGRTAVVPVTLNPGVTATPLATFLAQQLRLEDTNAALATARHDLDRVDDVLRKALAEAHASTSWRLTRWLRGFRPEPELAPSTTPEAVAVELLTLLRSKSWELTALLRAAVRALRVGWRRWPQRAARLPGAATPPAETTAEDERAIRLDLLAVPAAADGSRHQRELNIVCLHLFHLDQWEEFKVALRPIVGPDTPLYVSLPEVHAGFEARIRQDFDAQACRCCVVENRGLDVLPFLTQFRLLREHGPRPFTLTKLHTKRSEHVPPAEGDRWRRELYGALVSQHAAVIAAFHADPSLGMVCNARWWLAEGRGDDNFQAESRVIAEACARFDVPRSPAYLSGSMYTLRFDYLERLFADIDLDAYFASFPPGYYPSDTPAHAFERIVCYGLAKHGYRAGLC